MPEDLPARVAVHGSRLDRLEDDLKELKRIVEEGNRGIRDIRDIIMQTKGGWKTLMIVGGVAGTVGAAVAKLLPFLPFKP